MKKIMIFICFCLITVLLKTDRKPDDLEVFLINNDIRYQEIEPYLEYEKFMYKDFFILEKIRNEKNYSYLKTINTYYNPNTGPAILSNTTLILVNKNYYLDKTFIPQNLIEIKTLGIKHANKDILLPDIIINNYLDMIDDLNLDNLYIFSGFRTYQKQEALYKYYNDDNYSAKPGYSEHQTGLAIDVSLLNVGLIEDFENTKEFKILANNAHKYGFILRYPRNKQNITGYFYEPWHFRYVGKIHATYIKENNLTLEEYIINNFEL